MKVWGAILRVENAAKIEQSKEIISSKKWIVKLERCDFEFYILEACQ